MKYLILDVDGTLTDGKIYMGPDGEAMKAFSVKDGYVFNYILKPSNIKPIIITARNSSIVQQRCKELGITEVHQGKKDKLVVLEDIIGKEEFRDCVYFGDDILDLECMVPIKKAGGIIGCPSDSVSEIRQIADYVCINKAGEGALREFVEWLIASKGDEKEIDRRVEEAIEYLKGINVSNVVVGDRVEVNNKFHYTVQKYDTKSKEKCKIESHRKYIDIQFMISGEELIEIADISKLVIEENYNSNKDIMYWREPSRMTKVTLKSGDYIILYPENAHRGAVTIEETSHVLKIVGKVAID